MEEDDEESMEEFDENSDSDDEFDVHSWKESEEELWWSGRWSFWCIY